MYLIDSHTTKAVCNRSNISQSGLVGAYRFYVSTVRNTTVNRKGLIVFTKLFLKVPDELGRNVLLFNIEVVIEKREHAHAWRSNSKNRTRLSAGFWRFSTEFLEGWWSGRGVKPSSDFALEPSKVPLIFMPVE
jgi:hypothetical protein